MASLRRFPAPRMPRRLITEESVIFLSILKWFVLASVVGAVVGLSTGLFLILLAWTSHATQSNPDYFLLLCPAMLLCVVLVQRFAPDAKGHGTEKVIEAVHQDSGKIPAPVVPIKLLATVITLAAGGSVGKEGPCAQIGAGLASGFAGLMRFDDDDRKKLVICGISAGFAAVFGTPIAGAIFGVEVLFVGAILYDVLLPSFIAGIIAFEVSSALGVTYFHRPITVVPVFTERFLLIVLLAGVVFGMVSLALVYALRWGESLAEKVPLSPPLRAVVGGAVLIALTFAFGKRYLGLGLDTVEASLGGHSFGWQAPALKAAFTSVTLGFGGSGGIITPVFFLGATSGAAFGRALGLDVATFAAIGLVSLVAGAAQTPIAASIMAVELFGPAVAPYAAIACVISFLMTGHRSVYPSQILAFRKSQSIKVEVGERIESVRPVYESRERTLMSLLEKAAQRIRELKSKRTKESEQERGSGI